jgi:hypothetical protein
MSWRGDEPGTMQLVGEAEVIEHTADGASYLAWLVVSGDRWDMPDFSAFERPEMPWKYPPNRSDEYHKRAAEACADAEAATDETTRKTFRAPLSVTLRSP